MLAIIWPSLLLFVHNYTYLFNVCCCLFLYYYRIFRESIVQLLKNANITQLLKKACPTIIDIYTLILTRESHFDRYSHSQCWLHRPSMSRSKTLYIITFYENKAEWKNLKLLKFLELPNKNSTIINTYMRRATITNE